MSAYSTYEDARLSLLLREGDRHAFEAIYNKYWESLFNASYKRLRDIEACKDLVQNVFADLWRRKAEQVISDMAAYLHTAVRFQVFKYISRSRQSTPFTATFENLITSAWEADHSVQEKELRELALAWIETLPQKRKEILQLYYFNKLTTKEIAEKLHISQKTVQNQLGNATRSFDQDIAPIIALLLTNMVNG